MNTKDTGGPAFPRPMSTNPNNGYMVWEQDGMTLRDWFAGMAVQGMFASDTEESNITLDDKARVAYMIADLMLQRRQG